MTNRRFGTICYLPCYQKQTKSIDFGREGIRWLDGHIYGSKYFLRRYNSPQIVPYIRAFQTATWIHRDSVLRAIYFEVTTAGNITLVNQHHSWRVWFPIVHQQPFEGSQEQTRKGYLSRIEEDSNRILMELKWISHDFNVHDKHQTNPSTSQKLSCT